MKIRVHNQYFRESQAALDEISDAGLYPLEMEVPAVSNSSHWHDFSTCLYILSGELEITDSAAKEQFVAGPGSRVDVPARVLHAEHSALGYHIIAGMSVDPASLTRPVDLHPDQLLPGT